MFTQHNQVVCQVCRRHFERRPLGRKPRYCSLRCKLMARLAMPDGVIGPRSVAGAS